MRLAVLPQRFVRVRVAAFLQPSLQRALAGVPGPCVTAREGGDVVATLQEDAWARLAPRFASARVERGLRLIALEGGGDPALVRRLAEAAAREGIAAVPLPAFHRDYLVVPEQDADRCLEILARALQHAPRS
ncbi:MAG: hypothetical protein QN173_02420 [Armatimonadota bacterium]|nr:hypothetical protein [Armatimonadota bacterium]MDR7401716.1 hypothetical protein [Armatimonadota bacterium]MDR7404161.1 hypothetical protein [Armatimonadota bacterium]MDR7436274.1 hypothetical protein [Armatimonadota bacterium]MDR7471346.1 hypothetical protein [Armatimonadota bacterium]